MSLFSKLVILPLLLLSQAHAADLKDEVLFVHNKYRALHHAQKLVWDSALAEYALNHANKCQFRHSHSSYGENLATGYPSVSAAIRVWYDEGKNYSYAKPGFTMGTGHFTQVIWKSTQKIGCAIVACNGRNGTPGKYLVCEYSPAGNVLSKKYFDENVWPI